MAQKRTGVRRVALIGVSLAALLCASAAGAQAPPPPYPLEPPGAALRPGPPGEAAEIQACLCDQQEFGLLRASMDDKKAALAAVQQELSDLNAQLVSARPKIDVENPDSVARYKALLERHDAAYQRSVGPLVADAVAAVNRYNARVADYNRHCAHQLFDAPLMAQIQAHLVCPPGR